MSLFLLSVPEARGASMAAGSGLPHKGILGQYSYWGEGDMTEANQHHSLEFSFPAEECLFLLLRLLS